MDLLKKYEKFKRFARLEISTSVMKPLLLKTLDVFPVMILFITDVDISSGANLFDLN